MKYLYPYLLLSSIIVASCSKEKKEAPLEGDNFITVSVDGIAADLQIPQVEVAPISANTKRTIQQPADSAEVAEFGDAFVKSYLENPAIKSYKAIQNIQNQSSSHNAGLYAEAMTDGFRYKFVVVARKTGKRTAYNATAGSILRVEAIKGDSYDWYAYSYNNADNIPDPLASNIIKTRNDADFLATKGTIRADLSGNNRVSIIFERKVARIGFNVDVSTYPQSTINTVMASLSSDLTLYTGDYNFVAGNYTNSTHTESRIYSGTRVYFDPKFGANGKVQESKYYYTSQPSKINNASITVSDIMLNNQRSQKTWSIVNGASRKFDFPNLSLVNGKSITAMIKILDGGVLINGQRWARYNVGFNPVAFKNTNDFSPNQNDYLYISSVNSFVDRCRDVSPGNWKMPSKSDWNSLATAFEGRGEGSNQTYQYWKEGDVLDLPRIGYASSNGTGTTNSGEAFYWQTDHIVGLLSYVFTAAGNGGTFGQLSQTGSFSKPLRCIRQ